jgi:uncharacterized protein (TIGR04255 family)
MCSLLWRQEQPSGTVLAPMAAHYQKSPLVEAIFEFYFDDCTWGAEEREALHRTLAASYPGGTEEVSLPPNVQVEVQPALTQVQVWNPSRRQRFWAQDRGRMVQFDHEMCALNALRPYTHYVDYLPAMTELLTSYARMARPSRVRFAGQRYINRIVISAGEDPADFFTVYPRLARPSPEGGVFALQVQTGLVPSGKVVLNLARQGSDEEGCPVFLLDLYARTFDCPPLRCEEPELQKWQDVAHSEVEQAFELALTDRCRALLGRVDK